MIPPRSSVAAHETNAERRLRDALRHFADTASTSTDQRFPDAN
jgi:hypothetical protein